MTRSITWALTLLLLGLAQVTLAANHIDLSSGAEGAPTESQAIRTEDGEFSIVLPARPKTFSEATLEFDGGTRLFNQRVYVVCGIGIAFIVELYDATNPTKGLKALLDNRRYVESFERDVSLNGFNGKQYRRTWKDIDSRIQYFTGKKRIYVVQAIARDAGNPVIAQFFSSLTLGGNVGDVHNPFADNVSFAPTRTSDNQVFMQADVSRRAIPVWKPEPSYSGDALNRNTKGTVLLQVVVLTTGEVGEISVLKGLGHGLNEKAIEAAKSTLFIPAEKDGRVVSQYVKIEYNFDTGL